MTTQLQNSTILAFNNIGTTSISLIGVNPVRKKLTFHNPGSVDIVVAPTTVLANTAGGGSNNLTITTSALGGGFRVFANGGQIVIEGQACKQAWQGLSISASNNPLTIMEES